MTRAPRKPHAFYACSDKARCVSTHGAAEDKLILIHPLEGKRMAAEPKLTIDIVSDVV